MIRKPDGTPYQLKGTLQQFDKCSPAQDLLSRYDAEMIRISGSPIEYYEVFVQQQSVDRLYMEDRSKIWSPCAVVLWAFYEPPQQQNMSGMFSIDTPDEEIIFELNYRDAIKCIGHQPKIGSRIHTPHRNENWVIIDTRLDQFKLWGAIRLLLHCRKFQTRQQTLPGWRPSLGRTSRPDQSSVSPRTSISPVGLSLWK